MHPLAIVPRDGLIPAQPSVRPARDPLPGGAADSAEVTLRLAQDRGRIAQDVEGGRIAQDVEGGRIAEGVEGTNDIVVHRLFSAGLSLQTALGLMGDHPGAAKVQEAIGELDLAIRDFRNVLFDHLQPDPPPGRRPD